MYRLSCSKSANTYHQITFHTNPQQKWEEMGKQLFQHSNSITMKTTAMAFAEGKLLGGVPDIVILQGRTLGGRISYCKVKW